MADALGGGFGVAAAVDVAVGAIMADSRRILADTEDRPGTPNTDRRDTEDRNGVLLKLELLEFTLVLSTLRLLFANPNSSCNSSAVAVLNDERPPPERMAASILLRTRRKATEV